jgi:hypothetical protein
MIPVREEQNELSQHRNSNAAGSSVKPKYLPKIDWSECSRTGQMQEDKGNIELRNAVREVSFRLNGRREDASTKIKIEQVDEEEKREQQRHISFRLTYNQDEEELRPNGLAN